MGKDSLIDWTDHTWNPWQGCHKVSPGCKNCYMFRDKKRFGQDPEKVVRSSIATFRKPLLWKGPARVFVCSWSDFFIDEADQWRDEAWDIIKRSPSLTFQILTKRPERLPFDGYPKNVWVGVTAENQDMFEERMIYLSEISAPVKFVSVEPMLGDISIYNYRTDIDWIICGGESGPDARIMEERWAADLMNQCMEEDIPFFMKQMSGKNQKTRQEIPEHLYKREFPATGR
jgi:protein gp37